MRRLTAVAVLVLGLALVGYALFSKPSDEERIQAVFDDLARAVSYDAPPNPLQRVAQLNGAFRDLLSDDVVVEIAEVGVNSTGRSSLGQLGARASMGYESLELGFVDVSIEALATTANVSASARLTGSRGSETRSDERHAEFRFEKIAGDWRISRVYVSPPADAQQ